MCPPPPVNRASTGPQDNDSDEAPKKQAFDDTLRSLWLAMLPDGSRRKSKGIRRMAERELSIGGGGGGVLAHVEDDEAVVAVPVMVLRWLALPLMMRNLWGMATATCSSKPSMWRPPCCSNNMSNSWSASSSDMLSSLFMWRRNFFRDIISVSLMVSVAWYSSCSLILDFNSARARPSRPLL